MPYENVIPTRYFTLIRSGNGGESGSSSPALEYFHSEGFISKCGLSVAVETVGGQNASVDEDHALPSVP